MSQIGQTSLAVVPNMRGMRAKINAESKASARQAGRSMGDVFRKSGSDSGRMFGRAFRSQGGEVQKLVQDTTRANAQATQAWSRANRAHEDQLGRVRVAQAKLSDAVAKYGEGSTQAIVAQERLSAAQRKAEETGVRLTNAQDRLTASTQALKAAQEAAGRTGNVWSRMAKDLAPVSSMVSQVVSRVRDWAATNPAIMRFRGTMRDMGTDIAKVALSAYNFGDGLSKRVGGAVTNLGKRMSGAFNGFLMEHPRLNAAVTKIGDGFKAVGRTVQGAGTVFGSFGRAAVTGISSIGQALGPGLSAAWSGLRSQISGAATAFTSVLGGAATATGVIIAGALTKAFTGGFSRLSNIENAEAKMRGLGFAAGDIDAAMAGASDAVDGTAFALDEMASAASVAMAAGLKPGKELNAYMGTLKNAAAATGGSLGEMGSILNKTLTSGRAQTQEINQIADRGLPIWTKLQEQYGVTADELRKMVSEGKVDAETFMQVMNDMTGSVADEMGGTTTAAIANFGSALSKLGADMLQNLYPVIGPLFDALKSGLQMLQVFGAPAFEAFGAGFGPIGEKLTKFSEDWKKVRDGISEGLEPMEALKNVMPGVASAFERVGSAVEQFKSFFENMGSSMSPVIGGLVGALGPLLSRIPMIGGAFKGLTGPVGIFIGLLVAMWQESEVFRDAVGTVFETLMGVAEQVFPAILPLVEALGEAFNVVAGVLGDVLGEALNAIVPLIEPLAGVFMTLVEAVVPLVPIIGEVASILGEALVVGIQALTPLFELLGELMVLVQPIIMQLSDLVMGLLEAFMPLLEPLTALIGNILPPLIDLFTVILTPIMALAATIISSLMPIIQALITILTGLINFVTGVFTGNWQQAWNGIKQMFSGFVDGIKGLVKGLGNIIGGIKDTIMNVLGGIGGWLVDSGKALIDGFVKGIRAGFDFAADAVKKGLDFVRGFLPFSPAKRGPLSGAGWRRLKQSGEAYMGQWSAGVADEANRFELADLVQHVDGVDPLTATLAGAGRGGASGTSYDGPHTFNLYDENGTLMATFKGLLGGVLGAFDVGSSAARRGVAPGR